jgi:NhaP-type Na+/H+ or K+/H+ antiporter
MAVVDVIGEWLLLKTADRGRTAGTLEQVVVFGLALTAYFGLLMIEGNRFIAAFSGGIVFSAATHNRIAEPTEFKENTGTILSLLVWGGLGALAVPKALLYTTDWRPITYSVLSLAAIRMPPVALARRGADTVLLVGWFGPRGLASVDFMTFNDAGKAI